MSEEMREEFKNALWDKFSGYFSVSRKRALNYSEKTDEYINSFINDMYFMWKKSREAMKPIKLPVVNLKMPMDYRIGFSRAVYDCEDAIKQADYKVAE